MAEQGRIRMRCPNCGKIGRGKPSYLDREMTCPNCKQRVRFVRVTPEKERKRPVPPPPPGIARDAAVEQSREVPQPRLVPDEPQLTGSERRPSVWERQESEKADATAQPERPTALQPTGELDLQMKIGAWIGGGGLALLALSPLLKWVNFGAGGFTGITGDGKIVLGLTVAAAAAYLICLLSQRRVIPALLGVQAWGTVAVFWMGGLIWKVGSLLDSPEIKDNPFAAMLGSQVSPGTGLYVGLIGGAVVTGAAGYVVVRQLLRAKKVKYYYVSQGVSCLLGILVLFLVGFDRASDAGAGTEPVRMAFGIGGLAEEAPGPSLAVGETKVFGNLALTPLGAWKAPVAYKVEALFGDQVRRHDAPVLLLVLRVENRSTGQVFAPVPPFTDAYEAAKVIDNYGNRSFVSAICQFPEWPAWGQVGQKREKLTPGEVAVLVFVADDLENPDATSFTWELDLTVDNQFTQQRGSVPTGAEEIRSVEPSDATGEADVGTPPATAGAKREASQPQAQPGREKREYMRRVELYDLKAGYYTTFFDERVPGVEFKLRNNGTRTLSQVEVTVYFKDAQGNVIAEEDYHPVLVSSFSLEPSKPLKPGYIWQMERGKFYQAKNVPSEWQEGNVEASVTNIEFAGPGEGGETAGLESPEEQAYLEKLKLYDFQAKYYTTALDERVPGVEFKLKNSGERTLDLVEVTVYFMDRDGRVISEEDYHPVLVSEMSFEPSKPLKPGYIWQLERGKFYQAPHVPSEWQEGNAVAKITDLEFAQ